MILRTVAMIALVVAAVASTADAATCYRLPFSNPNLSDGFGSTRGRSNPHRGLDFAQAAGRSIPAVATGTVAVVTSTGCLGNVIVIKHGDGKYSGYSHMKSRSPLKVGRKVMRGQSVGKVGATGSCARGAHLHLTMSPVKGGYAAGTVIDPYKYIKAHKCSSNARVLDPGEDLDIEEPDTLDAEPLEQDELAELVAAAEEIDEEDDVGDDEDAEMDDADLEQGCSAGGSAGPGAVILAFALLRRRRKANV